ncbi:MAG: DUF3737 family protein [Ruminococcus flavefaciens]|nr:DUF3737 family protein [Ruminococcus flavefaciens]
MTVYQNEQFDQECALYGLNGASVQKCTFDGPADGESAFEEFSDIVVTDCFFNLRYPFWHSKNVTVTDSVVKGEYLGWYSENLILVRCHIIGTQPLCYCNGVSCLSENKQLCNER